VLQEFEELRRADADALQALIALGVPPERLDAVVIGRMVDSVAEMDAEAVGDAKTDGSKQGDATPVSGGDGGGDGE